MPYKDPKLRKECSDRYYRENAEHIKKVTKLWKINHPEEARRHVAEAHKRHPEVSEKWRKNHPNSFKAYRNKRRAAKTKAGGSFTPEQWLSLCNFYNNRCLCCKRKKPLEADHIIPISKGGTSNIENIQPLCRSCNAKKNAKTINYRTQPEGPAISRGRK